MRGEKGEKGDKSLPGESFMSTAEEDLDIKGKLLWNNGRPNLDTDAATAMFVLQQFILIKKSTSEEVSDVKDMALINTTEQITNKNDTLPAILIDFLK